MTRTLTLLFQRDPSQDRETEIAQFEGYKILWPDGRPVAIGVDALCKHGQRLLGLGKHLAGSREKLIGLIRFPLEGRDDNLNRLPGHRVRRFFIRRQGKEGRLYFMDGTPTTVAFEVDRDEAEVIEWLGLAAMEDGEEQWFDLAATEIGTALPALISRPRRLVCEVTS